MTDQELICTAIQVSSLSSRRFAERVMTRDERTIRRWVAGDSPIPVMASIRLHWFLALPASVRATLVRLLDRD